jgi:multidrug efflux pump
MLKDLLDGEGRGLPGGTLEMGYHETAIRMVGEPESPMALGGLALRSKDEGTVYLRDMARITPTLEKARVRTFIDKQNALVLAVMRKRNVNMVRIVDDVKALISRIQGQYPGLKTTLYFDQSKVINKRINELQTNALLGVMAVFIILWIALGIRNAVYASIGIPVAFLITFLLMKTFQLSINGVTLFGLILVLGILVDDAIVVLENIFRHIEMGKPPVQAALEGDGIVAATALRAERSSVGEHEAALEPGQEPANPIFIEPGLLPSHLASPCPVG